MICCATLFQHHPLVYLLHLLLDAPHIHLISIPQNFVSVVGLKGFLKLFSLWNGNYSNEVVVHTNCPFDYCRPEDNEISLYKQDQQCAFNRSGVLCGACQSGLSLALGSSCCKPCSNIYILLLIIFAMAGFVLIIILLKCNLTISTGTLNGLIFYANIVMISHAIFFPVQTANAFTHFLSIFIAWLNLDRGIEVCFFKSMDAYQDMVAVCVSCIHLDSGRINGLYEVFLN